MYLCEDNNIFGTNLEQKFNLFTCVLMTLVFITLIHFKIITYI